MKTIHIKYKFLTILFTISLNFYSQKNDTVKIGHQIWTSRNLDITKFQNGDVIPQVKTNEDWIKANNEEKPAWCYYNNDSLNGKLYGKLYNWYAVIDKRDLAPKGWRIPYSEDYISFAKYHEMGQFFMKSTSHWIKAGNPDIELYDGNGNNRYGFNGMPSGYRKTDGQFESIGYYTGFWSLSTYDTLTAWNLNLCASNNGPPLSTNYPKGFGLNVRLIKDEGLRRINDENDKLRIEIKTDLVQKKYDAVIDKLNTVCFGNGFVYYNDYETLIDCYLKTKNPSSAENIFNKVLKLYENDEVILYNNFGWNLILAQFYKPAVKYLEIARNKFPKDIYILGNLAHAYSLLGNIELANKIYVANIVKFDTLTIEHEEYASDGNIIYVSYGPEISKNDTSWIKMILEDFSYFKKEGISSQNFDVIKNIFNIKKENEKLRKEIDEDKVGNNDTAIYKLNKIISTNYFIEDYDYILLLEYYLKNNDLASAEKFFYECIQKHKVNEVNFYILLFEYYLKNNDLASAEKFFYECIQKHKVNEAKFYNELGWALISSKLYKPAVNYMKIATLRSNNYNLKIKVHYATALLLFGDTETAKKIFLENLFETDTIIGHIGTEGDSLIVFDSLNNKYNFIRMVGAETDWMALVRRNFERYERNGIDCPGFYEINELLISQQDAIMRNRIKLKKEKK